LHVIFRSISAITVSRINYVSRKKKAEMTVS
jgi:hypothetical protein